MELRFQAWHSVRIYQQHLKAENTALCESLIGLRLSAKNDVDNAAIVKCQHQTSLNLAALMRTLPELIPLGINVVVGRRVAVSVSRAFLKEGYKNGVIRGLIDHVAKKGRDYIGVEYDFGSFRVIRCVVSKVGMDFALFSCDE